MVDFGYVFPVGIKAFEQGLIALESDSELRPLLRIMVSDIYAEYKSLVKRINVIEAMLRKHVDTDTNAKILHSIPGVGVINASAYAASIGSAQAFKNAKELGVWLGLTPKQYASGDKSKMSGITKRGNCYLRKQLIHGARAIIARSLHKTDALSQWINQLREKKHFNCVVVATAHRLARLMWTLLTKQTLYSP